MSYHPTWYTFLYYHQFIHQCRRIFLLRILQWAQFKSFFEKTIMVPGDQTKGRDQNQIPSPCLLMGCRTIVLHPPSKITLFGSKWKYNRASNLEPTRIRVQLLLCMKESVPTWYFTIYSNETCSINPRESRLYFWKAINMNDYLTKIISHSTITRIDQIKPFFKF